MRVGKIAYFPLLNKNIIRKGGRLLKYLEPKSLIVFNLKEDEVALTAFKISSLKGVANLLLT